MMPTDSTLMPSVLTMNSGSRLWIISDEMSISRLTKPSTQTPRGMRWLPMDSLISVFWAIGNRRVPRQGKARRDEKPECSKST